MCLLPDQKWQKTSHYNYHPKQLQHANRRTLPFDIIVDLWLAD